MSAADALVIGGGPAGAACATRLAQAGRDVRLLERAPAASDKVCGGFLSVEALRELDALGIDAAALGAVPIHRIRLAARRAGAAEAALPFAARSLSRRVLDAALQGRAADAGATVRRGARVVALTRTDGLWRARLATGETVAAREAFLATGKHELRGWARPADGANGLIGFKQDWRLAPAQAAALDGTVELNLYPGGYAGLEPIEGGRANLCLLVRPERYHTAAGDWPGLLAALRAAAPMLDTRLAGGAPCTPHPLAVAAMPFGHLHRPAPDDGAAAPWRLGDQAAVAPSFTGDGMAIALHSARLAATTLLAGGVRIEFHRRLAADATGPVRRGQTLARLLLLSALQPPLTAAARAMPWLLRLCATATRLPLPAHDGTAMTRH